MGAKLGLKKGRGFKSSLVFTVKTIKYNNSI